jgi:hypothetical protein
MKRMFASMMASVAAIFALNGCMVQAEVGPGPDPVVVGDGTLSVGWSLDNSFNPDVCWFYDIAEVELLVEDQRDGFVDTFYAPCESFGMTVDLYDGVYDAELTLIDSFGYVASDTAFIDDVDIIAGTDITFDYDFPPYSIY